MAELRCVVERITFQNPENGYSILKVKVTGYRDLVTLVGSLLDVPAGAVLQVEGEWKMDARYGQQFVADTWQEVMPATIYGIQKYLGSGLVKGIGPIFAKRIVDHFGLETLDVIESDINRLHEVGGIGQKRIDKIHESWEKQKDIKDVMIFLQGYGVSTAYAAKIYRTYGKESIEKVKANPYTLADDIWGIGFKIADGIANKMGYEKNDPRRCRSGILYTLNQLSEEGHVFATLDQLIATEKNLLEVEEDSILLALNDMVQSESVIREEDAIYLPPLYHSEAGTARKLLSLLGSPTLFDQTDLDVNAISLKTGIDYDDVQIAAIKESVASKVMVLTGGPGTGKTTTVQGIIAAMQTASLRILLAAPTGRAAKRMTGATGMEAKTIHRLLEFKPDEGYQRNQENPLEGDVLIVDECSMIDIVLMNTLLKAIPLGMRLIMVGDIDQLPSVGAGNVLRDIIDSGKIPVVRLTRIFRQAQSSMIVMNAHAINQGNFPNIRNSKNGDFFYISVEDPQTAAEQIRELVQKRLPKAYNAGMEDIQVLTPMQKGVIGAANLNTILQEALNKTENCLSRGGFTYGQGDKVMQIRNNYDKDVYNGDIGTITRVDKIDRSLIVDFDGQHVCYDITELDELVLAYATTIHKSQGSEYPIVVMPVMMSHYVMLQRNLIYTGITRAKKICILVGTTKALAYAVHNVTVSKRNTKLKERLQQN